MDATEVENTLALAEQMLADFRDAASADPPPWHRLSTIAWNLCNQSQMILLYLGQSAPTDAATYQRAITCFSQFRDCVDRLPDVSKQNHEDHFRLQKVARSITHRVATLREFQLETRHLQSALTATLQDFFGADLSHDQGTATHIVLPPPPVNVQQKWEHIANAIASGAQAMDDLTWQGFEDLVAFLLDRFGWEVTPMGRTQDGGIDILAVKDVSPDVPLNMMVQCKRFSPKRLVGVHVVREVLAVKIENRLHHAMIATSSSFTAGAKQKANDWKLELKDHDQIVGWCKSYGTVLEPPSKGV